MKTRGSKVLGRWPHQAGQGAVVIITCEGKWVEGMKNRRGLFSLQFLLFTQVFLVFILCEQIIKIQTGRHFQL